MEIVRAAIQHLNPGQVPILALDQPLFVLARQIQWSWLTSLGEDHFALMLGGPHNYRDGYFKGIPFKIFKHL